MSWVSEAPLGYFGPLLCYLFMWLTLQLPVEHKKPCKPSTSSYRGSSSGSRTTSVFKRGLPGPGPQPLSLPLSVGSYIMRPGS